MVFLKGIKILLVVVLFLAVAVWGTYSLAFLSAWPPLARLQAGLDRLVVAIDQRLPRKGSKEVWLPGKVRIAEVNIGGRKQSLFFVNAQVTGWDPLGQQLQARPFAAGQTLTAAVSRGGLDTEPAGTAVFLPWTNTRPLAGLPPGQGPTFLIPDFLQEDRAGDITGTSTWSRVFCPGDVVTIGWKADRPWAETADIWGKLKTDLTVDAQVIFRYLRQTACD